MTRPVVWLPAAETELKEAAARYADIRPALGSRFAEAVEDTVEAIAAAPLRFPVVAQQKRRQESAASPTACSSSSKTLALLSSPAFTGNTLASPLALLQTNPDDSRSIRHPPHCVSVLLEQPNTMNGIVEGVTGNAVWAGITRFRRLFGNRIKITSPGFRETLSGGEKVGNTVRYKVHGTLKHLPKNHRIWLLTEDDANGRVWPQAFETVEYDVSTGT